MNVKTAEKLLVPVTEKDISKARRLLRQAVEFTRQAPIEVINADRIGVLRYASTPYEVQYYYCDEHYDVSYRVFNNHSVCFLHKGRKAQWGRRNTQRIIITETQWDELILAVRTM